MTLPRSLAIALVALSSSAALAGPFEPVHPVGKVTVREHMFAGRVARPEEANIAEKATRDTTYDFGNDGKLRSKAVVHDVVDDGFVSLSHTKTTYNPKTGDETGRTAFHFINFGLLDGVDLHLSRSRTAHDGKSAQDFELRLGREPGKKAFLKILVGGHELKRGAEAPALPAE